MAHKYRVGDYIFFGAYLCKIVQVWSADQYFASHVFHDMTMSGGKFPVSESEIRPASEDEIQEYLGNEEDDLS